MGKCNLLYKDSFITHISIIRSLVFLYLLCSSLNKSPCLANFQLFVFKKEEGRGYLKKGRANYNLGLHSFSQQIVLGAERKEQTALTQQMT